MTRARAHVRTRRTPRHVAHRTERRSHATKSGATVARIGAQPPTCIVFFAHPNMAAVQPASTSAPPVAPDIPPPSPAPAPSDAQLRRLPRPGTFSHARLPRAASAALPRGRSYHGGKPLSPAAQAARDGYFARKAAKLYAERRKGASSASPAPPAQQQPPASPPPALQPSNHNDRDVEVINITVDATGFKIDDHKKLPRTTSTNPSRKNSRARMTRSSSRQRNSYNRPPEDKENLLTDARLEAHIEAYFNRKRAAANATNAPPPLGADVRHPQNSCTSNHSWDGSMPKRRNSRSVIERDHAINQRTSAVRAAKAPTTATSPLPKVLHLHNSSDSCEPNPHVRHVQATQAAMARPDETHAITSTTAETMQHDAHSSEQTPQDGGGTATQLPGSGKWCDECAGVGLHICALLSELEAHRSSCDAAANSADNHHCSSSSGSKKGWKSMVTQTVLGDSKSKSASEKTRLVQQINVLRATVDFLYKKIERMENGNNDDASATSATSR